VSLADHQLLLLERAHQPGGVAGIQPELGPQGSHVLAEATDLVDQTCLAERPAHPQEVLGERADALRESAIEAPDGLQVGMSHSLTIVKE
jgi:hypothetical protein